MEALILAKSSSYFFKRRCINDPQNEKKSMPVRRLVGRRQQGKARGLLYRWAVHGANAFGCRLPGLGACMIAVAVFGFGGARADRNELIETSYEVNVSGITVLDVKYSADIAATAYRSHASLMTRGIATLFSDYRMEIAAAGRFIDGTANPIQLISRREKKGKLKTVELNWTDGVLQLSDRQLAKDPDTQADMKAALTPGVTDPLTAILRLATSQTGGPCQSTRRIFDGKEIFEVRFRLQQEVLFGDDTPGAYHGKAYECEMTYVPVAGRYATKFKSRREIPPIYTVWLAPIQLDEAGRSLLVPVRATGELEGLKFVATTSHATINGRPFKGLNKTEN